MQRKRRFSAFVASGEDPRPAIIEATDFARKFMDEAGLNSKTQVKTLIVVEELVSNVLRHKDPAEGVHLTLSLDRGKGAVRLELDDDSAAFNATLGRAFTGPDPLQGGHVGLAIVRAWSSDMSYARKDDRNRLGLTVK
jgi:anti-sigma regulatory factor (Ser/Thr protein kinase)